MAVAVQPGVELIDIEHHPAEQSRGVYLHRYGDIFSFTLYWTLVLYTPIYFMCAGLAFYNVTFPGRKRNHDGGEWWEMQLLSRPRKTNERRSRLTFALIMLLVFLAMCVLGALVGSTITSVMMLALWRSGHYSMSTWIPFLAALMQVLVGLMSAWPSVINII
ncbi:hypothetical protein BDZ89DRAFT_940299 [Hymenopellis radicata]|nr:hypothetical protein BDZ89DRAFT_940299 [Hymenopellis radicata]